MAQNSLRSGSKKTKSGGVRVDFTVKNGRVHGGERGYAQIPHTLLYYFTLFNTLSHSSTPSCPDLLCSGNSLVISRCRVKIQDPYSGVLLCTVLWVWNSRPLQRGITMYDIVGMGRWYRMYISVVEFQYVN
jgi:hypothetical protein